MVMIFHAEDPDVSKEKSQKNKNENNANRSFHDSMKHLMFISQFFALFPLNGVLNSNYKDMHFSWSSFRTIYCLIVSFAAVVEGIWCAYFLAQANINFEIYETNVIMFYGRGVLTCLAFLKLAKGWPSLMKEFDTVENIFRFYPSSKYLPTKLKIISVGIFTAASIEHFSVQIINLVKSFRCTDSVADSFHYFFAYISYRQIFHFIPYSFIVGVFLQVLNLFITFGWTFIDVFIVYASINFSEKLVQLNNQICLVMKKEVQSPTTWRSLRDNYTRLLHLFTHFNSELDNIILVSFASNIFFLLTQVFSWMRANWNGEVALTHVYFLFSISLLVSRTSFVCFFGSSIQEESQNLLKTLVAVPSNMYNEEVERFIVQLSTSPMILSGSKYFYITRSLILKIAGSIVTYELVMIQFTEEIMKESNPSAC